MKLNKRLIVFLLIIVILSLFSIYYPYLQPTGKVTQINYEKETGVLLRVVDGDTIKLANGENVRLLGINTPEKNMPYASLGKEFLQQFVNKTIYLERDREDLDKYKRKLRYIYFENRLLNLEIVERGFANAYMVDDIRYKDAFLRAEEQARLSEAGIWEKSDNSCVNCILLENINTINDSFILVNSCDFSCNLSAWFVKDSGRNIMYLSVINSNEQRTFQSKKSVWNDAGDEFFLFDEKGKLVLYFKY
jgi:micrococcal nuclease